MLQQSLNVAYSDGSSQVLWKDGERVFSGGWRLDDTGNRATRPGSFHHDHVPLMVAVLLAIAVRGCPGGGSAATGAGVASLFTRRRRSKRFYRRNRYLQCSVRCRRLDRRCNRDRDNHVGL